MIYYSLDSTIRAIRVPNDKGKLRCWEEMVEIETSNSMKHSLNS